MSSTPEPQSEALGLPRPYRSHKQRACDLCRKNKSRCTVDVVGASCLLCRLRGVECQFVKPYTPRRASRRPISQSILPSSLSHGRAPIQEATDSPAMMQSVPTEDRNVSHDKTLEMQSPSGSASSDNGEAVASFPILGVAGAHDTNFIEQQLSPQTSSKSYEYHGLFKVYSNDPQKPVLYTTESQQKLSFPSSRGLMISQRQLMEQVIGPFTGDLLELYIHKFHSSFPIGDSTALLTAHKRSESALSGLSDALICAIYSSSLVYWNSSEILASHPRPDLQFCRNLAESALQEDFASPRLSTIHSCLILLSGRPVYSIISNSMNIGRVVTLGNSLGLNRDPTLWGIPKHQKEYRMRLWWGILIHDAWTGLARGIPQHIIPGHYDVPHPTLTNVYSLTEPTPDRLRSIDGFILLYNLSVILRDILILICDLRPKSYPDLAKRLRRFEVKLDYWEESLSLWNKAESLKLDTIMNGTSGLRFGYLTVRMLICRVLLHESISSKDPKVAELRQLHQTQCRQAAQDAVDFIGNLERVNFEEFWMPYTSSHLTVAATLLLRCALETADSTVADKCMSDLNSFQQALEKARNEYGWELGETCLHRCKSYITRIATAKVGGPTLEAPAGLEIDPRVYESIQENAMDPRMFDINASFSPSMQWGALETTDYFDAFDYNSSFSAMP